LTAMQEKNRLTDSHLESFRLLWRQQQSGAA
jgi:hypothetical protein